jgi:signal transduction histidine kinase/signal recognition particle receptor subunit beta
MGFVNVAERTIHAKLVYYGVGVGGKTTSLQQVHGIFCPRNEVKLVSINTEEDSTLLFDFLPINLGNVGGYKIRIQGYTVPGQPKYKQMRRYVLQGADAVVFVVDSQRSRLPENLESLQSMRDNLRATLGSDEAIPIVLQYNKRDLPAVLGEAELDEQFRFRPDLAAFPSVATEGQGVFEAFVHAAALLVENKVAQYGIATGAQSPAAIAEGVRTKLWQIADAARRARAVVPVERLPQERFAVPEPLPDGLRLSLSDESAVRQAPSADPGEDDFDLRYELRDSAGQHAGGLPGEQVLSDADLEVDLGSAAIDFAPPEREGEGDSAAHLLDQTVQSNLELAQRYGVLDEQRLLLERKVQDLVESTQQTVHDLNKPLSALRLLLSTLDKGYLGELAGPVRQAVQNGLLAAQQMDRMVHDLLDSSRLDHDGMQMQFAATDLTAVVAGVVRTLQPELDQCGGTVACSDLGTVCADAWALTKVFLNLLGNAIAYARPGVPPQIRVSVEDGGEAWQIAVADNGIGVPEADRSRLFRRFERGSNTAGVSGTGLGLHIVKEIVQGHGGWVALQSTVGSGSTFVLHLPKQPVQPAHSPVTEAAARADL